MHIPDPKTLLGSAALSFIGQTHEMLIGGEWCPAVSGETLEVIDPASGKILTHVAAGGAADVNAAVAAARRAFETGPWPRMTETERGQADLETGRPAGGA